MIVGVRGFLLMRWSESACSSNVVAVEKRVNIVCDRRPIIENPRHSWICINHIIGILVIVLENLIITSPKRNLPTQTGWEGFFPYYAGYPESFANNILKSAGLNSRSIILDPWNGSGTTIYASRELGFSAIGLDINPVMIVVARARLLAASEADSLVPLSKAIIARSRRTAGTSATEPLGAWFTYDTARKIRAIERSIRAYLVGQLTVHNDGVDINHLSSIASALYVGLFSVIRKFAASFQSSNPTWMRAARSEGQLIAIPPKTIESEFLARVGSMADALASRPHSPLDHQTAEARLADSTSLELPCGSIDFVLTSPPYCTRIDYATATRIEFAILSGLVAVDVPNLSRKMMGSIRVPAKKLTVDPTWGDTCGKLLGAIKAHPSKASAGYYLSTHLDYFQKLGASVHQISRSLKEGGKAVLVVQDSFYKDLHNDLPTIVSEIGESRGLKLRRREDFLLRRSMSDIHPHSRNYPRQHGATESVLCFTKEGDAHAS